MGRIIKNKRVKKLLRLVSLNKRDSSEKQALSVQKKIRKFVKQAEGAKVISLGQNCSTAWYLKALGFKKSSYPFDWVFSSSAIVEDCINDGFAHFLDKSLMFPIKGGKATGHNYYHLSMFNHKNPLNDQNDYEYYQRCVTRFMDDLHDSTPTVYLITLINEGAKRANWKNGFTNGFPTPTNQNEESVASLKKLILSKKGNAKFLIIDHYTDTDRRMDARLVDENTLFITFNAKGKSTGVFYPDEQDDFYYKLMLSGLSECVNT